MPIDRDGDGPPLRRPDNKVSLTPGEGRGGDLRATPFTEDVFNDDYYGRRVRRTEGSKSLSVVVGVLLGIAVAGGAGYYFLHGSGLTFTPGELSFIKADPTPYKIRPENPGGMQVENQDKLVYDRVAKGNAPARVENLLPPAEEPKAPPMKPKVEVPAEEAPKPAAPAPVPAPVAAPEPAKEPVKEAAPQVAEIKPAAGKPVPLTAPPAATPAPQADPLAAAVAAATGGRASATGPINVAPQTAAVPAAAAPVPEVPKTAPVEQPVVAAPPITAQTAVAPPTAGPAPATPAAGPGYQIQLASVLSEQAALAEWGRIKGKNKDILGAYSPFVTRADLGEKGVFYRLRAGPLADKAAAEALCSSLAAANVGCIVVKP